MGSGDMLTLRAFMIGATTCSIAYNLLQPTPLVLPAYWGVLFIVGHSVQISKLLIEQSDVTLDGEELDLYDQAFLPYGFTSRHFHQLLDQGRAQWLAYEEGALLVQEGEPMDHVIVVLGKGDGDGADECNCSVASAGAATAPGGGGAKGGLTVSCKGETVHSIDELALAAHKGVWVGEPWHVRDCAASPARSPLGHPPEVARWRQTVRAGAGGVRAVRFQLAPFRKVLAENASARTAARRLQVADLHGKLDAADRGHMELERSQKAHIEALQQQMVQRSLATYTLMVSMAVSDGKLTEVERATLHNFRKMRGITEEQHLQAFLRAGWEAGEADPY